MEQYEALAGHSREAELLFAGSILCGPERAKEVGWLLPDQFVDHEIRDWWAGVLAGDDPVKAAIDRGLFYRFIGAMNEGNLDFTHQPVFARVIQEDYRLRELAQGAQRLAQAISRRDLAEATHAIDGLRLSAIAERDSWKAFSLCDALLPRGPIEYAVAGVLEVPSLNMVYGPPGCLKSFMTAQMLLDISAGVDFLPPAPWKPDGQPGYKTQKSPVMWLDFDNGVRRTHDRFAALARGRSLTGEQADLTYYSMPSPWLDGMDRQSVAALCERVKAHGAKVVAIDTLGQVLGGADENSGQMAVLMSSFRQVGEDTGAAVLLIHHQRKSNGFSGRAGDSLRGHSSIEAALDLALLVERAEGEDVIRVRPTKCRGESVKPFSAVFTYERCPETGGLESARFFGIGGVPSKGEALEGAIKGVLGQSSLSKTRLVQAVRAEMPEAGINRVRDCIERLVSNGVLVESPGQRTERLLALSGEAK